MIIKDLSMDCSWNTCVSNKDVVTNANKMGKEVKNDKNKIISYSREAFHTDEYSYVLGIDIQ